ncbi:MAG: Gfo/Idh/MocA family oxidoreductase [Rhodospirillales bacterium]|nr:Gfo/Idh/MocA family oxidoreductase [Rhodospirillales bacterium]
MINAAISGLGRWGSVLVKSVQGKSDNIRFVSGVVRDIPKYLELADETGIQLTDDYAAVLADPGVDAVVLATPPFTHGGDITAAAKAGKHIYAEKPLTLDPAEAREIADICTCAGVTLAVGFNRRFYPSMQALGALIADGRIGNILHVEAQFCGPTNYRTPEGSWRSERGANPAGGMVPRGIHCLDAMIDLVGDVASLSALSDNRERGNDIDDTTSVHLKFQNGATGYLATIMATGEYWRFHVFGSNGWIELSDPQSLTISDLDGNLETQSFDTVDLERCALEAFAAAIEGGGAFPVDPAQAVHGVEVHSAITRAIETGQVVSLG